MNWLNQWWWQAIHPHQLAIKYTLRWYLYGTYFTASAVSILPKPAEKVVLQRGLEPPTC